MKYNLIFLIVLFINVGVKSQTIDERVDSILTTMSLAEKVGQMTQVERTALNNIQDLATYGIGSILSGGGSSPTPNTRASWASMYDNFQSAALQSNLGIPIIYAIDAVHGHNNVFGAVIFPHNIGLGCTWNPELIETANQIVAKEVAATGIDWTFAPCIAVPRNERWGRTYEGFGETAEIQKMMATASVVGLQGSDLSAGETILACAKHFVGDGGTNGGTDQGNTSASEETLRNIHMEGYIDAIEVGVGSVMASYSSWNDEKLHGHEYLLTEVLKNELGFEGFVISDWKGVDQIDEDYRTAIKRAINAGIDMVMVPDRYEVFINHLISLVEDSEVSEGRINDAVKRILKQKILLNLFNKPYTDNTLASSFGSQAHRDVARQVVRESLVLLNAKNDVLPLQKNNQTIMVAGELASDLGAQCGGWTISWQGSNGDITTGTDILSGIENLSESSEIIYSPNGDYNGSVDVAVVVVGEKIPYAEGLGDQATLHLDETDINLLKDLKEAGIPTIAILVSGRPLIIGEMLPYTDAVIAAWYPGTEGEGIAEVLFGAYQPSGQLTHSWPKEMSQIPINFGDVDYTPLFNYKHGLQAFPTHDSIDKLLPYAAVTSKDGQKIILTLSDNITAMNAGHTDFEIWIDGVVNPNTIEAIDISDFDPSILVISLNAPISINADISISYSSANIISSNLVLDTLDHYYVYNAASNQATTQIIPGKIEAENYVEMNGIQTEPCSDAGGGLNVGYIEAGDWLKYNVEVKQSGVYNMVNRISGFTGGTLLITFNDSIQSNVNYSSSEGWQNWQDFSTSINLDAGFYTMQVHAQSDAFNINYFDFELMTTSIGENYTSVQDIKVYPNPTVDVLTLELSTILSQKISIKLFDPSGNLIQFFYSGDINTGASTFTFPMYSISAGIYFIEIKNKGKRYFRKVIKN